MPSTKTTPQLKGHFLLGNLLEFKANPLKALCSWQHENGDIFGFKAATKQMYLFSHPRYIDQALIKQSDVFVKMYDANKPNGLSFVLGQGLVTSQGPLWQKQRRLIQPVFKRSNLSSMTVEMVRAGDNMLNRWQQLEQNTIVNLTDEMLRLTMDAISHTMFSTSVMGKVEEISSAIDISLRYAAATIANPLTPPLFVPTPTNRRFKKAISFLDELFFDLIKQRKQQQTPQHDLLTMLINARDPESDTKMNNQQIRDEVITIFAAGHETTAALLVWSLYLLTKHPDVLKELRSEQAQLLKGKTPDADDLQSLHYCRAVLNESMRIYPPVGFIMRDVNKDTKIDGYPIKAGSIALFNIYHLHHHPEFWTEAEKFNPQRFLNAENKRFSFMPFGAGERVCVGNHFAMMEAQLLLTMITQHYDLQLVNDEKVEMEMAITIKPKGGIPVRLIKRPS